VQSNERKRRPWDKIIALATTGVFALTVLCVSLVVTLGNTRTTEAAVVTDVANALFRADGSLNSEVAFRILRAAENNERTTEFRLFPDIVGAMQLARVRSFRFVSATNDRITLFADSYRRIEFNHNLVINGVEPNVYNHPNRSSTVRTSLIDAFARIQAALPNVNNVILPKGPTIPNYNIDEDRMTSKILVTQVLPGPLSGNLKKGDVIVKINDKNCVTLEDFIYNYNKNSGTINLLEIERETQKIEVVINN